MTAECTSFANKKQRVGVQASGTFDGALQLTASYAVPGLMIADYHLPVPLDYSGNISGSINICFRVVTQRNKADASLPYLLYLQGGPGFESPRPTSNTGWLKTATNYFQVVLMDQRGTGLSTGISSSSLQRIGSPLEQARYLKCFRADSIVKDAEAIRKALVCSENHETRWTVLGQSFGGFCVATYLSFAPDGLEEALFTGGIPPGITEPCSADRVYTSLIARVKRQNAKFYARFPMDVERAQRIVLHLLNAPSGHVVTPAGNLLTPRSFQLLGLQCLGFAHGYERLHYLLEYAFAAGMDVLSHKFLKEFDMIMAWDTNPLYALLHEPIYCQAGGSSQWAAHRAREAHPDFDATLAVQNGQPVLFTGEMVFPWMFEEFAELRPLREAANLLAEDSEWSMLYDVEKLRKNTVPAAAATYYDDMFVDFYLAQETAGEIEGLRQHITNEWLHDGIREAGGPLVEKLLNMVRGGTLLR
jgi:pimeloyl-ACP methyl ester carboxylesterase